MIIRIDDPADERLADYRLLRGGAALRVQHGDEFFVAEGWTALGKVIESGHELRSVLLLPGRVERFRDEFADVIARGDVPVYVVDREVLEESVGFDLHRGVLGAAARRAGPTAARLAATSTRLAVLEGLNDAENVGLIARAARAFGIDGLILDARCTDPYARRSVRVSQGEILHLPTARLHSDDWPEVLSTFHDAGFATWALTPHAGATDIGALGAPDKVMLLLGAEGPGLSDAALDAADLRVRIPIRPEVDSLNVGHAAAVAFAAITGVIG